MHWIALRLTQMQMGIRTPTGKPRWNVARVRGIWKTPAYTGTADGNRGWQPRMASADGKRTRIVPATQRTSARLPVGPGFS